MLIYWYKDGKSSNHHSETGSSLGSLDAPNRVVIEKIDPDYMTYVDFIYGSARNRKAGIYRHKTAEGKLEWASLGGGSNGYRFHLTFKRVEDGRELRDLTFSGQIRPAISFDEPQLRRPRISDSLDGMEAGVALGVALGLYNSEIVDIYPSLTLRDVSKIVKGLLEKVGVRNRVELALALNN